MSPSNEWRGVIRGIVLSIGLAILILAIVLLLATILQALRIAPTSNWAFSTLVVLNAAAYFVGVTQLLYSVPLIIAFWRQQRFALMKGVIVGAAIVGFINFGYLWFLTVQYR